MIFFSIVFGCFLRSFCLLFCSHVCVWGCKLCLKSTLFKCSCYFLEVCVSSGERRLNNSTENMFALIVFLHFSFPFLFPDHQFGPFLCFLLRGLVFLVYLQAGNPLALHQGPPHLRSYRCMAGKWVSPWTWLLEGERRRFLTVLKQVRTFLFFSGVSLASVLL